MWQLSPMITLSDGAPRFFWWMGCLVRLWFCNCLCACLSSEPFVRKSMKNDPALIMISSHAFPALLSIDLSFFQMTLFSSVSLPLIFDFPSLLFVCEEFLAILLLLLPHFLTLHSSLRLLLACCICITCSPSVTQCTPVGRPGRW